MAKKIEKILELYPEYEKVYGPYKRKDGRKHVVLHKSKKSENDEVLKKTISYPKALVEIREKRRLSKNETVDHRDRDKENDALKNLDVVDRSKHMSIDALRRNDIVANCVECGTTITLTNDQVNARGINKSGPYCSKKCSGKYGQRVQETGIKRQSKDIVVTHYRLDKNTIKK